MNAEQQIPAMYNHTMRTLDDFLEMLLKILNGKASEKEKETAKEFIDYLSNEGTSLKAVMVPKTKADDLVKALKESPEKIKAMRFLMDGDDMTAVVVKDIDGPLLDEFLKEHGAEYGYDPVMPVDEFHKKHMQNDEAVANIADIGVKDDETLQKVVDNMSANGKDMTIVNSDNGKRKILLTQNDLDRLVSDKIVTGIDENQTNKKTAGEILNIVDQWHKAKDAEEAKKNAEKASKKGNGRE